MNDLHDKGKTSVEQSSYYFDIECPFKGLCENNKGKNFVISPIRQIFYCFKCRQGGDVISYVCKKNEISPLDAVKLLSQKYNIDIENFQLTGN